MIQLYYDKSIPSTEKIKFEEKSNIKLNYSYDQVFETSKYYYILDNHKLYKIYKKDKEKRILLFELPNDYNNLQIDEERIYYIHNQYLYRYDMYGVKTLVNNNEFKYNNTNIYHMYNNN